MTDLEMLEALAAPSGRRVLDVGCGGGALVRALATRGARMTGVEISDAQLAAARAADDGAGARYLVGRAEALPLDDASVDVVVFMRALHHVPIAAMDGALREAARVLVPGGVLYVAEPLARGDYFTLTALVEDEREVRAAAQAVLERAAESGLARERTVTYDVAVSVAGVDALRTRFVSVDPARAEVFDARAHEIGEAFARLGAAGTRPGERCFVQPMQADVLVSRGDSPT